MAAVSSYVARPLSPETWDDFARLVEANNGVWGGCWCMGFHPEGVGKGHTVAGNRLAKQAHVRNGTAHQMLVYEGEECVGWCQYGPPAELPNINNQKTYAKGLGELPDWRIGCIFTGSRHRRSGVATGSCRGRAGRHPRCWRWDRRGVSRAGRGAPASARCLLSHRHDRPVRGVRIRTRPEDRHVAMGDAAAHPAVTALGRLHRGGAGGPNSSRFP